MQSRTCYCFKILYDDIVQEFLIFKDRAALQWCYSEPNVFFRVSITLMKVEMSIKYIENEGKAQLNV